MKRFALALVALALVSLTDCSGLTNLRDAWTGASTVTVNDNGVLLARNTFVALEGTASNYLELKRCTGSNGPLCRSPAASKQIIAAIRSGRIARDQLVAFQRANPGQIGYGGALAALQSANDTLRQVFAIYNVGKG